MDDWTPEQKAYRCGKGRDCMCRTEEEREQAEQQLAERKARAAGHAAHDTPEARS